MNEWLVLDEDGDLAWNVWAPDADSALAEARLAMGDVDVTVSPVTPAMRRARRNARRRERYAERRDEGAIPSRAKPCGVDVPFGLYMRAFDFTAGRWRCARGHFCSPADLVDSPTGASFSGGHVSFAPTCRRCRATSPSP